jgi:mono/diheme cytochrome c family protein
MWKHFQWISAVLFFSVALISAPLPESQQPSSTAPSNTINQNPVIPTAATRAQAKQVYGYDCSMCHGQMGHGVTSLNKNSTGDVPDLDDSASVAQVTDKDLYEIILNGKGKMPGEKGRLKSDEVWSLVTYVRELGTKRPAISTNHTVH